MKKKQLRSTAIEENYRSERTGHDLSEEIEIGQKDVETGEESRT